MIEYNVENVRYIDDQSLDLQYQTQSLEENIDIIHALKEHYLSMYKALEMAREAEDDYYSSFYQSIEYYNIRFDRFTIQSITSIEGKILISAYRKGFNSRVYIFDLVTSKYEGMIVLDNRAHVGGISYDEDNQILFITGSNGEINSYDYKAIKELSDKYDGEYVINFNDNIDKFGEEQLTIKIKNNINVKKIDENAEASTIYYYNDRLYVGTFNPTNNGYLHSYKVLYDEEKREIRIVDEHTKKYRIGARIQGIGLTNIDGVEYLVCTQSLGVTKSVFLLYEIREEELVFLGRKYIDDVGLEGITINEYGTIIGVFENNDRKPIVLNIRKLISEVSDSWLDIIPGNQFAAWVGGMVYKYTHK